MVCGAHVLIRSRHDPPRCPVHRYPEKRVRSGLRAAAARVVRGASCVSCGAPATEADHRVPLSQGGHPLDMQPLCHACHRGKTAAMKQEGRGARGDGS
jgi:5-methylcytosine-specific restriction endonuclease McrA